MCSELGMVDTDNPRVHGYAGGHPRPMLQEKHQCPAALTIEELLVGLDPSVTEATNEHEIFYQRDVNHWCTVK